MYQAAQNRYQVIPYRRCGASGLMLPAVSLGLWHNFGDTAPYENMRALCRTAFDHGITHFDLANNYGPEPGAAERNFGKILRDDLGVYRDELIISTKAGYLMWDGPYGDWGSRKYLLASLDRSLQRMGLDYVDIFYHHRMDPNTPLEETMGALAQAVRSGKALYAGLSNYDGPTLEKAAAILDELHVPFVINQNRYSIFDRTIEHNGLKDTAAKLHKGIITFSPLAQGLLTDRYLHGIPADSRVHTDGRFLKEKDITPERLAQISALNDLARQRGQTLAEMALAWLLHHDEVTTVLIGASKTLFTHNKPPPAGKVFHDGRRLLLKDGFAGCTPAVPRPTYKPQKGRQRFPVGADSISARGGSRRRALSSGRGPGMPGPYRVAIVPGGMTFLRAMRRAACPQAAADVCHSGKVRGSPL